MAEMVPISLYRARKTGADEVAADGRARPGELRARFAAVVVLATAIAVCFATAGCW